jgi:hypothetical protein
MGKIDELLANKQNDQIAEITGEEALKHMVGEGAKYATVEDLAKAALNGQVHISKIEQENASLRDTSDKAKGIDDILAALKGQQHKDEDDGNHQHDDNHDKGGSDELSVADQITAAFAKRDQGQVAKQEDGNLIETVDLLSKAYGDKANEVLAKVGQTLGIDMEALAKKSPQAVMKLVADARPASDTNGLPPSTHMDTQQPSAGGVMTKSAIATLYKAGKLDRYQKIALENEMFTKLGAEKFNS